MVSRRRRIHIPYGSQQQRALQTPFLELPVHLQDQRVDIDVAMDLFIQTVLVYCSMSLGWISRREGGGSYLLF